MPCLKRRYQQGQAVLIVLLVAALALGFGLSIISRSTTDVKISEQEDQASRAFNAAEAGIENALGSLSSLVIGDDYNLTVDDVRVTYSVNGEDFLEGIYQENETATVVLGDGVLHTLTIEWGESCPGAASLLIAVIDSSNQLERYGWNACDLGDDFTYVADPGDDGYLRKKELAVAANSLVRIRPVYNKASIRVTGEPDLPVQAYGIDSQAQSPTLESKAIQVSRTVPAAPAIFDYVLFSGTNIVK